ncbi:DEAD/DEAH box helicase, partial [Acidimicrobiaceae bacterium]|nr:DEAD/DEAH box helicase [Acidimicrobiaceae bacterium]
MVDRSLHYLNEIPISELKGFGEKRVKSLHKSGIKSVTDLIRLFPKKHYDRSQIMNLSDILPDYDKEITIFGKITDVSVFTTKTRLRITTLTINDDTGLARAKWFGPQYIASRYKKDDIVAIAGIPDVKKTGTVEFKNPAIESFSSEQELSETGSFISFYPKIDGVPNKILREGIKQALKRIPEIKDIVDEKSLNEYSIYSRIDSYQKVHFPESFDEYKKAKKRLAFDEFLYLQSLFNHSKTIYQSEKKAFDLNIDDLFIDLFQKQIPFKLTSSQKKCIEEIYNDIKKASPMKRLLQGDVGSGKTIVAAAAVTATIKNNKQAALMAPTEVLAEQHLTSFKKYLEYFDVDIHLLTSSVKDREDIYEIIDRGDPVLIIGTHALIQDKVNFNNLGLAIIDEQQRFGVEQRKKLVDNDDFTPHQLVMTATPIPRTTALAIYGDLELSVIDELPPGRKKIKSRVLSGGKRDNKEVYEAAYEHLKNDSQIFVVCPYI